MGTVISDTFSGASLDLDAVNNPPNGHVPDTNVPADKYVILNVSPALKTTGSTGATAVGSFGTGSHIQADVISAGISDAVYSIDVVIPAASHKMAAGLIFRLASGSPEHYWLIDIQNSSGGAGTYEVHLQRRDNSTTTPAVDVVMASGLTLVANSVHTISVSVLGTAYMVFLDGVQQGSTYTDSSNTYTTAVKIGPFLLDDGTFVNTVLQNMTATTLPLAITQTTLPNGQVSTAYSQTLTSTGGYQPTVTYAVTAGVLPPGLALSSAGVLSGTPTTQGTYLFSVTASDTLADTTTTAFSLTITGGGASFNLLRPDAEQTPATRRFQQNVAQILNGLQYSGAIISIAGGGFTTGALAIGETVSGGDTTSLLYVSSTGKLADTVGGVVWDTGTTTLTVSNLTVASNFLAAALVTTTIEFSAGFPAATPLAGTMSFGGPFVTGYQMQYLGNSDSTIDCHVFQTGVVVPNNTAVAVLVGQTRDTTAIPVAARDSSGNMLGGFGPTNANALFAGRQGLTNPAFNVDASAATCVTGISVQSAASGAGVTIQATSSAGTDGMTWKSKNNGFMSFSAGTGTMTFGCGAFNMNAGSGAISMSGSSIAQPITTIVGSSSTALAVEKSGATSTAFQVDTSAASATTGLKITSKATGTGVTLAVIDGGAGSNDTLTITTIGTGGVALQGSGTNDSASAGQVGEFISSLVASGGALGISAATAKNITSINLTAGDWDVEGNVNFSTSASTFSGLQAGLSSTSATLPTDGSECYSGITGTLLSDTDTITLPRKRFSLATTTTIYLVGYCNVISAGTVSGFGSINARRVR